MEKQVEEFIARWQGQDGTERANYQLFLTELCELLELPKPDPASSDTEQNAYVFERRVDIKYPDGTETRGYIDLYKRSCFVLEAKQTSQHLDSERWDKSMLRAQAQADTYIRALPIDEGRPPFLIVTDVGRSIELYSEFSRSGAAYVPYPDPRSHRIKIEDLRDEAIRERLTNVWNEPLKLDPAKQSARVTRDIAAQLAELAKTLEGKYETEQVASFLMRCLFTMFAEDVGLIPHRSFTELLQSLKDTPEHFSPMLEGLWETMNKGGFSTEIRHKLLEFNGGLFAEATALPLDKPQIELLIKSALSDWRYVEPAIFGTLLERALSPSERHKLGAHYTPRTYVERLVLPTVIEPLREEWRNVQAASTTLEHDDKHDKAIQEVRNFHFKLCTLRILDPACGSGNFLYVTLEHMKRLEGEILNFLEAMGETQTLFELDGVTVDPHQFLGLEINPRASKIAEMVLWIGYLQWHFRTQGNVQPPTPVLRDFNNIECRDAVLAYDAIETALDDNGEPITQWDGVTNRFHPVTGKEVPDENARIEVEKYINPRRAEWPEADYVIGNPPFIGNTRMISTLGEGYTFALRKTYAEVSESCDYVMYWWHNSANLLKNRKIIRFGFITTNSIKQSFNRRVTEPFLRSKKPISIVFGIPDHPWVDSGDGADVRISMTSCTIGNVPGKLHKIIKEQNNILDSFNNRNIELLTKYGTIHSDLSIGANVAGAKSLTSNELISSLGVKVGGKGFILKPEVKEKLSYNTPTGEIIKRLLSGRDMSQSVRARYVIDLYGLQNEEVRELYPNIYQWILEHVKPQRDQNRRASRRENWWIFSEPISTFRPVLSGLKKYIATGRTSKHRIFQFIETDTLTDDGVVNFGLDNAYIHGVFSSRLNVLWSLKAGSRLGVGNDPVYVKTKCFETFAFPDANKDKQNHISQLAEQLDDHRKQRQAEHSDLTLTGMYNVLEKLRRGEALTSKEKTIHEQGLVSVLKEIHDDLDRAVFNAYDWDDLAEKLVGLPGATTPLTDKSDAQAEAEEELLKRLVELNAQRAAEEARGNIRWLRPEFQAPDRMPSQTQIDTTTQKIETEITTTTTDKITWPKELQSQIKVIRDQLGATPMTSDQLASQFRRKPVKGVQKILDALTDLGMITQNNGGIYSI